jgi:hypothetical protein
MPAAVPAADLCFLQAGDCLVWRQHAASPGTSAAAIAAVAVATAAANNAAGAAAAAF